MVSEQFAASYRPNPPRVVAGIVAAAFALGALTGFGLPRMLAGTSDPIRPSTMTVSTPSFLGVADNNMSDASDRARNGSGGHAPPIAGVANSNMSDAADRARNGPARRASSIAGVADNNMSDAARDAMDELALGSRQLDVAVQ